MSGSVLEDFASFLNRRGYRSIEDYRSMVNGFLLWLGPNEILLKDLTVDHLSRYLIHCRDRGLTRATLEATLVKLRIFCRYCFQHGLLPNIQAHEICLAWLDIPGGYPNYQGPFRKLFHRPEYAVRYVRLPFAKELSAYSESLIAAGYTKTQIRNILHANSSFQDHLVEKGKKRLEAVVPKDVQDFLRTKTHKHKFIRHQVQTYVERFLIDAFAKLGRKFHPPAPAKERQTRMARLLKDHEDFCRAHRGLKEATLEAYRHIFKTFETFLSRRGIRDIRKIALADIDAFVSKGFASWNAKNKQGVNSALRSFLRYLYLNGHLSTNLADKLYRPSRFSLDLRPKYFPWVKIQEFLSSIDRSSPKGKRDYAILLLFTSYGLRAREVIALKTEDVDFENERLTIQVRKGGKPASFPLRPEVMAALRDYLAVRPNAPIADLFLAFRNPAKPLGSHLRQVVADHLLKHFGRLLPSQGTYVLRHSFAKAMLDRGAPITDIAALFDHESLGSTLVYTSVATEDLRQVADNYANLLCPYPK